MFKRRKPKISMDEAMSRARDFIVQQNLKGWRFDVVEACRHPVDRDNWTVVVDRFSPEGGLVDGPQILIVDGETGEVRYSEEFC